MWSTVLKKCKNSAMTNVHSDMFLPNLQNVTFWRATRCGLAKNCSKTLKNGSYGFRRQALPDVDFTKMAKSSLFYCWFWRFWAFFGQTTSGSSPKQNNTDLWQKHVCLECNCLILQDIFERNFIASDPNILNCLCKNSKDWQKKLRHFSLLIAGANARPDGRVNIAKSPKRWTVRMKWTMIIVSIGLNALKMHALFPSLLLYITLQK